MNSRKNTLTAGITVILAASLLVATAVIGEGGLDLSSATHAEELLLLASGALICFSVLTAAKSLKPWGAVTALLFVLLTLFTALSITWSVEPSESWLESSKMLAFLAVFVTGIALSRRFPNRSSILLGSLLTACFALSSYAILTKVFPSWLNPNEELARLRAPFGYWNSVGLMAALGIPLTLWLGTDRGVNRWFRVCSLPVLSILIVTIMLSYSRGALVAAIFGATLWFALPTARRVRSLAVLASSSVVATLATKWIFSITELVNERVPLEDRISAGYKLGTIVLVMTLVLTFTGWLLEYLTDKRPLTTNSRKRIGQVTAVLAIACAVGALTAVSVSDQGLTGSISSKWSDLTSVDSGPPTNEPGRLGAVSSLRSRYWQEAFRIFEDNKLLGVGAGGYATARFKYRRSPFKVRHAHGYLVQTAADLGAVGFILSLALLTAWLLSTARTLGPWRSDKETASFSNESNRNVLFALTLVVVIFGVHSFVDWTWSVPGNAACTLLVAGWLSGLGPLSQNRGSSLSFKNGLRSRYRASVALFTVLLTISFIWTVAQPLQSKQASDASLDAVIDGNIAKAQKKADTARHKNPLSTEPLYDLATVAIQLGQDTKALELIEEAVKLQPRNPVVWERLARYQLATLESPAKALPSIQRALALDPRSPRIQSLFLLTRNLLASQIEEQRILKQMQRDRKKQQRKAQSDKTENDSLTATTDSSSPTNGIP